MDSSVFTFDYGGGPVIATALHNGHQTRDDLASYFAITEEERLREEDPFTGLWTDIAATSLIGNLSRFEVDLNRPRHKSVYRQPEDSWGITVWRAEIPEELVARSMADYDLFYRVTESLLTRLIAEHGKVLVVDLHTYNHRRDGRDAHPADPLANPEINVGTGTMDRARWGPVVDAFLSKARELPYLDRQLDVRENVRFRGGEMVRWMHEHFPENVCALAVEVKKFFMDEWTGIPNPEELFAMRSFLRDTVAEAVEALDEC